MKYINSISFFCFVLFLVSCHQQKKVEVKVFGKPEIEFDTLEYSFDTLSFKEEAKFRFKFSNVGDQPLIIKDVVPSCGCTATEYSEAPIKSGECGVIKIKYDTKRIGRFYKSIKVYTNAQNEAIVLKINGFVKNSE